MYYSYAYSREYAYTTRIYIYSVILYSREYVYDSLYPYCTYELVLCLLESVEYAYCARTCTHKQVCIVCTYEL